MRRRLVVTLVVVVLLGAGLVAAYVWLNKPMPTGRTGPAADAMAHAVEAAVNKTAWEQTGAVRFTFRGKNEHLWDRVQHRDRVRWDDYEVWLDLDTQTGAVARAGALLGDKEANSALKRAYKAWINDSFWLNQLAKLFDPGVERAIVTDSEYGEQLLVRYTSGGLTPGDAYLWQLDASHRPLSWKMWVSILPAGGVRATWERWTTLSTGAVVATLHHIGPQRVELTNVAGARTLAELEPGPDPFARLQH